MRYASDCYASGPRSIGSSICTFIRTCIWILIFNLEIPYEIFFQRSPRICCPYLSGSRYGTGMGYAFTYAIGFQTKASLVCKWKRNRLWIHRPWIFYRELRNRYFWFNPGRQRRSKSRGYGLTMNYSSTDLNYCGFPSVPKASIRCSSRLVAGAAVALPVVPIPIG